MLGNGVMEMIQPNMLLEEANRLGYPLYFFTWLGVAKITGSLLLVIPQVGKKLNELAYAGFFFDFLFAFLTLMSIKDYKTAIAPIAFMALLYVSYHYKNKLTNKTNKMIVGVFKYKINPKFQEEFDYLYGHATKYLDAIKGYDGHVTYDGEDGEKMLVVHFKDKESFLVWDEHPEHKKYKERGKKDIFEYYDVSVGEIFERHIK